MTGLLHRMAARAAGTAVTVRSDAGLPYMGDGSGRRHIGEAQVHVPIAAAPRAQVSAGTGLPQTQRATGPVESVNAPPDTEPVRAPPAVVAAHADAVLQDASTIAVSIESASSAESAQYSAVFDEPRTAKAPLHAARVASRDALGTIEPESAAIRAPPEDPIIARGAMRIRDPAPLMPHEALPISLSTVWQPSTGRGPLGHAIAATHTEDTTEVHIHIGSIDVTAVHEAPAPRRSAATVPAPLSLDGYLAQRGRS